MQRWSALVFLVALAALVGLVVVESGRKEPVRAASPDAGAENGAAPAEADAGAAAEAVDGGEDAGAGEAAEAAPGGSDAGATLLSGEAPPALPADAPKSVVFGVILVQYRGAQGAPPTTRSREAALELAKKIAEEAKTDFRAAVAKGDRGSMENAGRMPRGVLEPAPEYVLFSLPKGGVSEPVDTPKGFWVVRRIE